MEKTKVTVGWQSPLLPTLEEQRFIPPHVFVKPGDSLTSIVRRNMAYRDSQHLASLVKSLASLNELKNPNLIHPGDILLLPNVPSSQILEDMSCHYPPSILDSLKSYDRELTLQEKQDAAQTSMVMDGLAMGFGITGAFSEFVKASNGIDKNAMNELISSHITFQEAKNNAFNQGGKIRAQSNYNTAARNARSKLRLVNRDVTHLTVTEGRQVHLQYRQTGKAVIPARWESRITKLKNLSKAAKGLGVGLIAVDLGIACHQIANTSSSLLKNSTAIQAGTSLGIGTAIGYGISLTVAASPIGWIGIIGLSAAAGFLTTKTGQGFAWGYEELVKSGVLPEIKLVESVGIETVCEKLFGD